ncbi:MAG: hypothetical protein JXR70_08835 [Spirochaetales bacterium]|nr:hypothetical protein [Spirochaetales bacterium]
MAIEKRLSQQSAEIGYNTDTAVAQAAGKTYIRFHVSNRQEYIRLVYELEKHEKIEQ